MALMPTRLRSITFAFPLALAALSAAPAVDAFCGFYVAGSDQKLFNNATNVVLMRQGTWILCGNGVPASIL